MDLFNLFWRQRYYCHQFQSRILFVRYEKINVDTWNEELRPMLTRQSPLKVDQLSFHLTIESQNIFYKKLYILTRWDIYSRGFLYLVDLLIHHAHLNIHLNLVWKLMWFVARTKSGIKISSSKHMMIDLYINLLWRAWCWDEMDCCPSSNAHRVGHSWDPTTHQFKSQDQNWDGTRKKLTSEANSQRE